MEQIQKQGRHAELVFPQSSTLFSKFVPCKEKRGSIS